MLPRKPSWRTETSPSRARRRLDPENFLEAFLVSTGVVALGEMGDKTQLLAMLLAVRFRQPAPIILGILVATLFNHASAGLVGGWAR